MNLIGSIFFLGRGLLWHFLRSAPVRLFPRRAEYNYRPHGYKKRLRMFSAITVPHDALPIAAIPASDRNSRRFSATGISGVEGQLTKT
jgi:hypothetical protein